MLLLDNDMAVIKNVLQGKQADYATLVSKYQRFVFSIALRYVTNREVAEELSQDVFVKAYRNLPNFKGECKFSTWLYTIVHTTCLSHLRKKKDNTVLLEEETMIILHDKQSQQDGVINNYELTDKTTAINAAISHLPESDAQIVTLYYMAEQSVNEIAAITGMSVPNVKVKLFRSRMKLKEIIEQKFKQELID